jgi:drug/metabolite transporter (DMT)-like permease
LALFTGFAFATNNMLLRKGMHISGESVSPVFIATLHGVVVCGFAVVFTGDISRLASVSWLGVISLAVAGILHFVVGTALNYSGIRLIGATRAAPIFSSSSIIAAVVGSVFFGEQFTLTLLLAISLVMGGVILIGVAGEKRTAQSNIHSGSLVKGITAALGGAVCWGVSPAFIKIGILEVGSPLLATFISFVAAFLILAIALIHRDTRMKLHGLDKRSLVVFLVASTAMSTGMIARFYALYFSAISLVVPLINSARIVSLFPLSYAINRRIETFNFKVIIGALAIIGGIVAIFSVP